MKIFREMKLPQNKKLSPTAAAVVDFVSDVVVIFVLVLLIIKPFFFAPFRVEQQSMMPNVMNGEFIIVWKTPYLLGENYKRNDIIVFRPPKTESYLIKRVIGLPGETIRFFKGFVWVEDQNGEFQKLDESFLALSNLDNTCLSAGFCTDVEKETEIDFEVPAGEYFVMGDNRLASRDARSCFEMVCGENSSHFLTQDEIEGRAVLTFARIWRENGKQKFTVANARIFGDPLKN